MEDVVKSEKNGGGQMLTLPLNALGAAFLIGEDDPPFFLLFTTSSMKL